MSYQVKVDVSPIFEFLSSFLIYSTHRWTGNLDLGSGWLTQVRSRLNEQEASQLETSIFWPFDDYDVLYAWAISRQPKTKITDFIRHLNQTPAELLLSEIAELLPSLSLETVKRISDKYPPVLYLWYERYFKDVEQEHEVYLREDVLEKKTLQGIIEPSALIELATSGILVGDYLPISEVVLLPTLHLRPLNTYCFYNRVLMIQYPIDFPEKDGQPPNVLLRLTSALADPERLRLLRFIASVGPKSLEEIRSGMPETGDKLAHHLMMLRVAGLLRVHLELHNQEKYSLREDGASELQIFLESYIQV